jgi:hypothetical protein
MNIEPALLMPLDNIIEPQEAQRRNIKNNNNNLAWAPCD